MPLVPTALFCRAGTPASHVHAGHVWQHVKLSSLTAYQHGYGTDIGHTTQEQRLWLRTHFVDID